MPTSSQDPPTQRTATYRVGSYRTGRTETYRTSLRRPSSRRELVSQAAVLLAVAGVGVLLLLLGVALHADDARRGQREALLQLDRLLESEETVLARAEVTRRHWWDHFRTTPGVLAATDRRLIYVGTVPPALFRPSDDPPSYEAWSFAYDTSLAARVSGGVAGAGAAILVRTPEHAEARYGIGGGERPQATSVATAVTARRNDRLAEIRRQQALFDSVAALPPPPPQVHRVRPGESLYGIAALYNVTPEVLKAMNRRTGDRIRIGEELIVRRFRRINGAVVEFYGPE
jgi:hypothetical protein